VKRGPAAGLAGAALTAVTAAGAARAAYAALTRRPPRGEKTWTRTNHRGEPVTLLEGPAVALGAVATQLFYSERTRSSVRTAPALAAAGGRQDPTTRTALALALAGAGALGFGVYDDLAGSGKRRGLRGHLGALAHGEVTTGAVKLGGLGATGLASALLLGGRPADVAVNAGLVAGGANLLNLFDLRPGRAIKVATISAALIAASARTTPPDDGDLHLATTGSLPHSSGARGLAAVAAPLGAALALLPEDLGERAMLGDAGANALGAMLGGAAAVGLPRPARIALLAGIVALTGASEKVSFTKVIERTPPLRWLDMLGRRPPAIVPAPRRDPEPLGVAAVRSGKNSRPTRQEP
jgi:UDP-GlcNAc:undecaprenyl-phosphate/decaprenyl-phosphate GlcNAc-1-phosphate transferase